MNMKDQIAAFVQEANRRGYLNPEKIWEWYDHLDDGEVLSILTNSTGDDPQDVVAYLTAFHMQLRAVTYPSKSPRALTDEEIKYFLTTQVRQGRPVRFQHNGRTMNISTGNFQERGINVMHQIVYWNFPEEVAHQIASLTGTKPVFSE